MDFMIDGLVWQVTQELVWAAWAARAVKKIKGRQIENGLKSHRMAGPSRWLINVR
ncbi:MAG TPA: hypothetical protein PLO63_11975 [Syntrophales bacterium]|jgi:hypothetical protein|nr:hypothetical protein [Syntrophales bacterium]